MNGYWPWWAGALALGTITAGYALWTGRSLGISGAWERVVTWRESRELERLDSEFADVTDLQAALAAATAEEFGVEAAAAGSGSATRSAIRASERTTGGTPAPRRAMPVVCYATLLVSVFLGGLIGALVSGHFALRTDMGPGFREIVTGNSLLMTVILFVGGIMVGFGTRMAGGCSSGHGLSGCSRLQPVSFLATAVFFGTAVGVSFLLLKVI